MRLPTLSDVQARLLRFWQRAWPTRAFKLTLIVLLIALPTKAPWLLLLPMAYYGSILFRMAIEKILYSTRAKLGAFYLFAGILPFLLILAASLFVGYLVLSQVSSQIVEQRLHALSTWAEQSSRRIENIYWQRRLAGTSVRRAAAEALQNVHENFEDGRLAWWAVSDGDTVVTRGPYQAYEPLAPRWVRPKRFAGLTSRRNDTLELRVHLPFRDGNQDVVLGSALLVETDLLNLGLATRGENLHGDVGKPDRSLHWTRALSVREVFDQGVVATLEIKSNLTASIAGKQDSLLGIDRAQRDSVGIRDAIRKQLRSRFPVLKWVYIGYPVSWDDGSTSFAGPPLRVAFTVEGAIRALAKTELAFSRVLWWIALSVIVFFLILQLMATWQGLSYARAISTAVAKLDQGVRAVQSGDFSFRIRPKERDQLGGLSLAFNGMSERMQQLLEETASMRAVEKELNIAREVQERLFPVEVPSTSYMEVSGVCLPARLVSGDYYDYLETDDGYDMIVADVSGKGMSAALLMASLHAALHSQYLGNGQQPLEPQTVLTRLNRHLNRHVEPTRFVTLFLVRYGGDGVLKYCNAGHNPAALVRDGRVQWLREGGLMLGPFPDHEYRAQEVQMQQDDLVCLYTDGITEALNDRGEQFGDERFEQLLEAHGSSSPRQLQDKILQVISEWRGGSEASDDVTLLLLKVRQPQRPES